MINGTVRNPGNYPRLRGEELRSRWYPRAPQELPPLARGRGAATSITTTRGGITPACAGKRDRESGEDSLRGNYPRLRGEEARIWQNPAKSLELPPLARGRVDIENYFLPRQWNYPRLRGEERLIVSWRGRSWELPPLARGRVPRPRSRMRRAGITPACAGKSWALAVPNSAEWNYPRLRGEESNPVTVLIFHEELPPLARGRGVTRGGKAQPPGITTACAGKSHARALLYPELGNYPRLRGEELFCGAGGAAVLELPPLARGRGSSPRRRGSRIGITPACAGKSEFNIAQAIEALNYPRLRGEEHITFISETVASELPPLARGRDGLSKSSPRLKRITPACAGKRLEELAESRLPRNYPRLRGEEYKPCVPRISRSELPPLARGRDPGEGVSAHGGGITPACAGKRLPDLVVYPRRAWKTGWNRVPDFRFSARCARYAGPPGVAAMSDTTS